MCKKLIYLISFILVLGLVGSASARLNVTWSYNEVDADNWWNNPNNWLGTRLEYGNLPGFDDRVLISTEGPKAPVIDARMNGVDSPEAYFNQLRIGQDANGLLMITGGRLMGCGSVRLGPSVGAGTIIMTGGLLDTITYWNDTGGSGRLDIGDRGGSDSQPITHHLMHMSGDSECHLMGVLQVGQWQSRRNYTQYGHLQLDDNALMDCGSLSIRCDDGEQGTAIDANTLSARGTIDIAGNGTLQIREDALNEYDFGTQDEMAWYGGLSLRDYIDLGYITGYGRVRALTVTYDAGTNITTIVADPEGGPGRAYEPFPHSGAIDVPLDVMVCHWVPGDNAVQHDVYFGKTFEDVNGADISDTMGIYRGRQDPNSYTFSEALEWGATWYWRIDEIEADNTIHKGAVWNFTAIDHLVVEDFEAYNDLDPGDPNSNRIFNVWLDGYGVATNGSLVGYENPPFCEQNIFHSGSQAMPFFYDNNDVAKYSEATMTLSHPRDWTEQGVGVLSLWFRGQPPYFGSFTEAPTGTYTMTARGVDIWDESDQFHFAYKQLSGGGTIIAKVESVENTHEWAKAGVMIRDTLEADSRHAMVAVTPTNGIWFGRRETIGDSSSSVNEPGIPVPQWVKIERTVAGLVRAYYSADGTTWTQLGTPTTVIMDTPVYIGLALTSHDADVTCKAVFSNVTSDGTGDWADQDIGIGSNDPEPMYVAIADQTNPAVVVYNDDPSAAQIDTWTQWTIDLQKFAGVDLTNVDRLSIGLGEADNPQSGAGLVFCDDIRLYRPVLPEPESAP